MLLMNIIHHQFLTYPFFTVFLFHCKSVCFFISFDSILKYSEILPLKILNYSLSRLILCVLRYKQQIKKKTKNRKNNEWICFKLPVRNTYTLILGL